MRDPVRASRLDVAFAGMGLANALAAVRVATLRPELRIAGFDTQRLGGRGPHLVVLRHRRDAGATGLAAAAAAPGMAGL